jgi:ComF family protein
MTLTQTGRRRNPAFRLYHLLWKAVDWLYPPYCGGCGQPGARWCADCQASARRIGADLCPLCGQFQAEGQLCSHCRQKSPSYCAIRSWALYQGTLREAIHSLKYNHDIALAESLAVHLIEMYNDLRWPVDLITAVPLGSKRALERGYNQAAMLARPLGLYARIPFSPRALRRTRETESQVRLGPLERHANVRDAFAANASLVHGKVVLVIDDVTTTGATIESCAHALRNAGAVDVYGLTVARAGRQVSETGQLADAR